MLDIAVLEKIVIVHVWEEEELDYETSEAYLIKPGYAMYVLALFIWQEWREFIKRVCIVFTLKIGALHLFN
ncbi:hypothetical protein NLX78_19395 [Paenibacillus sp. Lou8.1]|uniref:hypothetical protein n=1 Tax=Paenibacillus sp. Lou8.1 TaxID=2962041 RepID=UPI0020B65227|nr:hypothetical protein [Paenibacillus sp. Lou8.1]MCP3809407.1 hypothetical protein [Paenibacillus sp. Lou8.1]